MSPSCRTACCPTLPVGQLREHRLYQADWLLRFYGFTAEEIAPEGENLPLEYDPKCAWALRNPQHFPVEVNTAPLEMLLRVPGIGGRGAYKITEARRYAALDFDDLKRMRIVLKRAKHFITCKGKYLGAGDERAVKGLLALGARQDEARQLSLFRRARALEPGRRGRVGRCGRRACIERRGLGGRVGRRGRRAGALPRRAAAWARGRRRLRR